MLVRNLRDKEVLETTYIAHGGAIAQMVLDRRDLKEIGFLASATLSPGKVIEAHVDPMEEIYFFLNGEGEMSVGEDSKYVVPGDAVWVPTGSSHSVRNTGESDLFMLVVAAPWWLRGE